MEILLALLAGSAFALSPTLAPLALRCGLSACLRFSPRAAAALSACAACCACLCALFVRGVRAVPAHALFPLSVSSIIGGTAGRAALLMLCARFPSSLSLSRLQALPLLLLALSQFPFRRPLQASEPKQAHSLALLALLGAACGGFFGAGALALFTLPVRGGVLRRRFAPPASALLCAALAQASALLLTLLCSAAQVFPRRMIVLLSLGAALGAFAFERSKKRGALLTKLHAALWVYVVFAALSGAEQAYL